jgi:hypothetical protein
VLYADKTLNCQKLWFMKRLVGVVLFIAGLVGTFITGLNAYDNTESLKIFGKQITVSQADWTPVIISGAVAVLGLLILVSGGSKKKSKARR